MHSYPTVVIEMNDHQNPSHDPFMNDKETPRCSSMCPVMKYLTLNTFM